MLSLVVLLQIVAEFLSDNLFFKLHITPIYFCSVRDYCYVPHLLSLTLQIVTDASVIRSQPYRKQLTRARDEGGTSRFPAFTEAGVIHFCLGINV